MTDTAPSVSARPALGGFHHFSPTVNDVEASAAWYERVFGLQRVPARFPHHPDGGAGDARSPTTDPIPYSVLIFRDPDDVPLELVHVPG